MPDILKQKAVKIILKAAQKYDENLKNRSFMVIYKMRDGLDYKIINFEDNNFKHLTGQKNDISPKNFYDRCINNYLSEKDIPYPDGKTNMKLGVLPYLHEIFFLNCKIGDYFFSTGVNLKCDYVIGCKQRNLCIGLRKDRDRDIYFPCSLLNDDISQRTRPTFEVKAIFRKNKSDEYFSEYTYCKKDFDTGLKYRKKKK